MPRRPASAFTTCAPRRGAGSAASEPCREPSGLRPAAAMTVAISVASLSEPELAVHFLPLYPQGPAQVSRHGQEQHAAERPARFHGSGVALQHHGFRAELRGFCESFLPESDRSGKRRLYVCGELLVRGTDTVRVLVESIEFPVMIGNSLRLQTSVVVIWCRIVP